MWGTLGAAAISGLAQLGGGFMSASGAASANAANLAQQNMINQQMLNAQMAQHGQQTAFMEDQQNFNREERQYAENFNAQQAANNRAFQDAQTQKMLDFQERMSNSAYQRATADMRAAGINPMLAYMQGGASSPMGGAGSGATASSPGASSGMASASGAPSLGAAHQENTQAELGRAVGRIASSAVDTYKMGEQAKLTQDQQELTKENTRRVGYETTVLDRQAGKINSEIDINKQEVENRKLMADYLKANTAKTLNEAVEAGANARDAQRWGSGRHTPGPVDRALRTLGDYGAPVPLPEPLSNRSF